MPLYVHYVPETGKIVSFQEAPDGDADDIADGLESLTITEKTRPVWVKDQAQPEMHYPDINDMKVVDGKLARK